MHFAEGHYDWQPSVVEVTLWGTEHNMLMFITWMDTEANRGQGTPSGEHSVVMSVEDKATLGLQQSFVDSTTHTVLFCLSLQRSFIDQQFGNSASWQSKMDKADIRIIFKYMPKYFMSRCKCKMSGVRFRPAVPFHLYVPLSKETLYPSCKLQHFLV